MLKENAVNLEENSFDDATKVAVNIKENPVNIAENPVNIEKNPVNIPPAAINLAPAPVKLAERPVNLAAHSFKGKVGVAKGAMHLGGG